MPKNTYYRWGTLKSSETYGYTNSTWGDLLTNYNGTTITYDASGNPTNWKDVTNLFWTGKRLTEVTFTNATTNSAYKALWMQYDANGIRTSKQYVEHVVGAPSYVVTYTTDGKRILSEQRTGTDPHTICYVYDANGVGQPVLHRRGSKPVPLQRVLLRCRNGSCIFFMHLRHMNETRFSNNFVEKRVLC